MNGYYYVAADPAVYHHQRMASATRLQQQKPGGTAVRKRSLSAILEEQVQVLADEPSQADCIQLFEQFGSKSNEGPQLLEDFHSFLAREGCSNHPWITSSSPDLPTSDEDFVAYLARSNGISDSTTITKLRQVLGQPTVPRKPRTRFAVQPASRWQGVV